MFADDINRNKYIASNLKCLHVCVITAGPEIFKLKIIFQEKL